MSFSYLPQVLGILTVVLIAFGVGLAVAYRRVVPTNMVHIVQTTKRTTPYGRDKPAGNTYYAWPSWVPFFGITYTELPESNFQVTLNDYEAYDQARLPFVVDVTAFFRVEKAELAAQRVPSFVELKDDLKAVLQGAVRRILATNSLEEIMQSRSTLGDQFTDEVREQIAEWGVQPVKTIEFMDLRDSTKGNVIANIMAKEQSRIDKESRVSVAENKRAAQLAEIDAERTVEVQRQDAAQQVGLRTAEKEKAVGIALEESKQEVLTAAKTTTERNMEVKQVQDVRTAEIERDVASVRAHQDKTVAVVNAEAQSQTQVVRAEGEKQAQVVKAEGDKLSVVAKAEGDLAAAMKDADGIRARGEAHAAAEQAMLMAPVTTQITLAKEIGENPGYQAYLVTIAQVDAGKEVGKEMAKALQNADLKVIANSGDVQHGVASLGDLLSPAGGTKLSGMLAAIGQTDEGKAFLSHLGQKAPALAAGAAAAAATGSAAVGAIAAAASEATS